MPRRSERSPVWGRLTGYSDRATTRAGRTCRPRRTRAPAREAGRRSSAIRRQEPRPLLGRTGPRLGIERLLLALGNLVLSQLRGFVVDRRPVRFDARTTLGIAECGSVSQWNLVMLRTAVGTAIGDRRSPALGFEVGAEVGDARWPCTIGTIVLLRRLLVPAALADHRAFAAKSRRASPSSRAGQRWCSENSRSSSLVICWTRCSIVTRTSVRAA